MDQHDDAADRAAWAMATGEPCFICGDPDNHAGQPHAEVLGDGRTREDLGDYADLERCRHCRYPLTLGGVAFLCGGPGAGTMRLPSHCARAACRQARDDAAIEKAIAAGVITR